MSKGKIMWRKINIVLVIGIIALSCTKNTNNVKTEDVSIEEMPGNQTSTALACQTEEERIRDLLHTQARRATEYNESVLFMMKGNFGIPGGDNWLVEWSPADTNSYTILLLYLIKDNVILKYYNLGLNNNKDGEDVQSRYDIMKDIPGTHIGNGTSSVGDFNNDGMDEVFCYAFGGNGYFIVITGYDATTDDFPNYCYIPFDFVDPENGPAPVEFMTYKGMEGFKVYYVATNVAGGPGYVPEPMPDNEKLFFYTWDEEKREYVRVEEAAE
jgi:hypothetical protein